MQTLITIWGDEFRRFNYFYDDVEGVYYMNFGGGNVFYTPLLNIPLYAFDNYDLDFYKLPDAGDKPHWSC